MYSTAKLFLLLFLYLKTSESQLTKLVSEVDLTWPFDVDTIYWKNTQPFVYTKKTAELRPNSYWYSANEFCAGEHGGTHFDAPYHFNKNGWKVGDIPLANLIVNGIMVDLTQETKLLGDKAKLLPEHLQSWEKNHGSIPDNCVILVKFGWSEYYSDKIKYLGIDKNGNYNFPGLSEAAAEWISQSKKVVGVGVDTASVDPGTETNSSAHRILSQNQIYILENIKMPIAFPEEGYFLYVMPMKIKEGTGAPLRLIAVPFNNEHNGSKIPWLGHVTVVFSSIILLLFSVNLFE